MKTKVLAIAIVLVAFLCGNAKADNVDLQTAKQLGAYYFTVATGAKAPIDADDLTLAQQFDNPTLCIPAMYAFNVEGNGFIVVSACDGVEPILAYSPEGYINPTSKLVNPACQYMLDSYADIIRDVQNSNAKTSNKVKALWDQLYNQTYSVDLSKAGVLVQTKWDQGENDRASYNAFCPKKNGKYCYAGCVAVAMSQIIKYWNYPERGGNENSSIASCPWGGTTLKYKFLVDSNKFVYDSMITRITPYSEWNYIRAIGKLIYACGVTVKMGWDPEGSGAQSTEVPTALSNWFKYSPDAVHRQRAGMSDANWCSMLHEEIVDHLRPVYYSGFDGTSGGRDAGHAWVVCGEHPTDNTKFYINWGWGGASNGYFTLAPASAIQTASGYKFNTSHDMVYRIFPNNLGIDDNTTYTVSPAYPNPATDYMIIPVDLPNSAAMGIYSADGKLIEKIVVPANTKEYRLNLQHYAPGTYIYRLNGNVCKFTVL